MTPQETSNSKANGAGVIGSSAWLGLMYRSFAFLRDTKGATSAVFKSMSRINKTPQNVGHPQERFIRSYGYVAYWKESLRWGIQYAKEYPVLLCKRFSCQLAIAQTECRILSLKIVNLFL